MGKRARPGGGIADLARIGLGEGHKLRRVACRHGRMHHQHKGQPRQKADRRQIRRRVKAKRRVQNFRRAAGPANRHTQRMAISRARHGFCADMPAAASAVFHNHRLTKHLL